jgi:2-phosphoglycerate kinase
VTSDQIWLVGGASGTGKSRLAYELARSRGVPIVEIDDIVEALLAVTTSKEQPALHFWATHPEAHGWSADRILELHLATARALVPAIEAVIANHLATDMPVVLEGDYLLPETAARESFGGQPNRRRVRPVFLVEQDPRRVVRNYRSREPDDGEQLGRAEVSVLFGAWLIDEAARLGVPVLAARPWSTLNQRAADALGLPPPGPRDDRARIA